ncbi:unnamed protein product [Bathycoccus prasinos]
MPTGRDILDATRLLCTRALKVKSERSCLEGATSSSSESSLKRELGALDLIFFGIGGVVGAGVFVLTGAAAQEHAGPAVVISYLLATITSLITATAYTEFAIQIPVTGSAYNYIALTFGEYIAFITGCNLALELTIAGAAVARGFTSYFSTLIGQSPNALRFVVYESLIEIDVVAFLLVGVLTVLLVVGMKETAKFNIAVTSAALLSVVFVLITGSTSVNEENWKPFVPPEFGFRGILSGASMVFFAFVGFDTVATLAEETKKPSRDLPIGILGSLTICGCLYCFMALVITGMVHYTEINVDAPFAVAFDNNHEHWASVVVSVGAVFAITTSLLSSLMGQPRVYMTMSRDGLLPEWFAQVSPRFGTPANASIFTGVTTGLLALVVDIDILAQLVSIGTLSIFLSVNMGLMVRRYTPKDGTSFKDRSPALLRCALLCASSMIFSGLYIQNEPSWSLIVMAVSIVLETGSFYMLDVEEMNIPTAGDFKTPFVPWLPALGVLATSQLLVSLGAVAWVRYILYTSICTIGYCVANILKIRDGRINWRDEVAVSDAMYASPYSNSSKLVKAGGLIVSLDIQQEALDITRRRIREEFCEHISDEAERKKMEERVYFARTCHSVFESVVDGIAEKKGKKKSETNEIEIGAFTMNLGYLTGKDTDKSIVTRTRTTLEALDKASKLLRVGGLITICCYRGHEGGSEETDAVLDFVSRFPPEITVTKIDVLNRSGPVLLSCYRQR